jgi:putative oxidoreductase
MTWNRATQIAYFLLRAVSGLMFFHHGAQKMLGWFGGMPDDPGTIPTLFSLIGIGGTIELLGGLAIMIGVFTRPVAFVCSGQMAVAYWMFHAKDGLWPIVNHGELAVLYCFLFLFVSAFGGGDFSLDALIRRQREQRLRAAALARLPG